jgi:hypothetical protein
MKITKSQIRRLIKEEVMDLLKNPYDPTVVINDPDPGPDPVELELIEPEEDKSKQHLRQQPPTDDFLMKVLWEVIADYGKSKDWDHFDPLDGGTIGIAHFAAGGLQEFHKGLPSSLTQKYFNRTPEQLVKDTTLPTKGDCRGTTPRGQNDNGTGCYVSLPWWNEGMKKLLSNKDATVKDVQFRLWRDNVTVKPANELIDKYKVNDERWGTARGRAIAYCLVNSGHKKLLQRCSANGKRSPNETMEWYNEHSVKRAKTDRKTGEKTVEGYVRTRMRNLNKLFPDPDFKPKYKPGSYK